MKPVPCPSLSAIVPATSASNPSVTGVIGAAAAATSDSSCARGAAKVVATAIGMRLVMKTTTSNAVMDTKGR